MQITRNDDETGRRPADWFTGTVVIDAVAAAPPLNAAAGQCTPGARTDEEYGEATG